MDKKALIEALLELGRYLLFAAVSWGVSYLAKLPQSEGVIIGTMVLRLVDKYIHEAKNIKANGLAPF
jgi:hypothetical protein